MIDNPIPSQDPTEWFVENLPSTHLDFPDYYIYQTLLEVEDLEDIKETRGQFKKLITEKRIEKNIPLPATPDKEMEQFLNPSNTALQIERSREFITLTAKFLREGKDVVEANRLAAEQIFHTEAPLHQPKMNEAYFNNRELVEADLRKYLAQTDKNSTEELSTKIPKPSTSIQASNGEEVKWNTYLKRASKIFFGTDEKKSTKNPHRKADALKKLKNICGIEAGGYDEMNESYFGNSENIKHDLEQFLSETDKTSIDELTVKTPGENISVVTFSRQRVKWNTYLSRASGALLGTEYKKGSKNPHRTSDALRELKKICGIEVKEYDPMDEVYFCNRELVEVDLKKFLNQTDKTSIDELSTLIPGRSDSITASNGEEVKWSTYLIRASKIILGTVTNKKAKKPHRPANALDELKRICEIKLMNEAYFKNPNFVRCDLERFLAKTDKESIFELTTTTPRASTATIASNDEEVKWQTYLNRASTDLLGTTGAKNKGNPHRNSDALKRLKEIAAQSDNKDEN